MLQPLRDLCHFVLYDAFIVTVETLDERNVADLLFVEFILDCLIVKLAFLDFS